MTSVVSAVGRTVSQVAQDSGTSASAIRFYEAQGLIKATRTAGNQRRFREDAACRVKAARVAQRVGLTVNEVRELLDTLPPNPTLPDWQALHGHLKDEAERRIAELNAVLADISSGAKLCEL
jgi:MerR family transcriptional regulator, redox-sensitive transcriptional activator SoxR